MIEIKKLNGHITLVTEQMPQMRSAAIGIWVRTGAVNETPEIAGISHFIEHMTFKGTKTRSAAKLAEDMESIGAQMNAFTGKEMTCYYFKSLESNFKEGLEILLDMFTASVFDPQEMEREKQVIYEEMKMTRDTPDEDAHDTMGELLFRNSPYGNSIIGTEDVLAKIDRDTLTGYLADQYVQDSIVISVAGKFDEKMVEEMIEGKLAHLKETKESPILTSEELEPAFTVKARDIEQTHICMAARTVKLSDPDYYAHRVLSCIMGGGMSSRLFQHVREQKGLAYSVYSSCNPFSEDGYYNIYAGVSHDRIAEAIEAIRGELLLLGEKGVSDEEIAKAKTQIKSSYIFGQESVNGRMVGIGQTCILLGKVRTQDEVLASIDAVDQQAVARAIAKIADPGRYSAVAVTNKEFDLGAMVQGR